MRVLVFLLAPWLLPVGAASAACFEHAAQRYQVPEVLLRAIAQQESGGNAHAINRNSNGSFDIGLMQINSFWFPTLARHGIAPQHLYDPCVSTLVGAWILSQGFARLGYNPQGLGAYNASSPEKREHYARQVLRRVAHLSALGAPVPAAQAAQAVVGQAATQRWNSQPSPVQYAQLGTVPVRP